MESILCAIDRSPSSASVAGWGIMLARKLDRTLILFHAIHTPSDQLYPSTEFERGGDLEAQRQEVQKDLEALMGSVDIPWQAQIVLGDPAEMLADYCRQHPVGLVVAGRLEIKGVKRLLMGTVVQRLARMLCCPLLVVRPEMEASAGFDRLGLCCDLHADTASVIEQGVALSQAVSAKMHLLHAMESAVDTRWVDPDEGPYGEVQNRMQQRLKDHLRAMVPEKYGLSRQAVPVHLAAGQAAEQLPLLVRKLKLDLLMVGVQSKRSFGKWVVGSTTEAVLRRNNCHVLTIPVGRSGMDARKLPQPFKDIGIVRDPVFLTHRGPIGHCENYLRLEQIYTLLDEQDHGLPLKSLAPRRATMEELALVHTDAYIQKIATTADLEGCQLTADTYACPESFNAACMAAGGVLAAIDAVVNGEVANAFVLARPPGHHAEVSRASGFCLFNNTAIGAQYARERLGLKRVLIVDWDLHHGNGIQHIFEQDPDVLYISTHQYPCFPGTGHHLEVGMGQGEGYTINLPLKKGWGDGDYAALFLQLIRPVALAYNPDLLLVSTGFDTHKKDPLGKMRMTETGFSALTRILMDVANVCCHDRMVLVLEGGYHTRALASSVQAVLAELCGKTRTDPQELAAKAKERRVSQVVLRSRHILAHIWPCLQPSADRTGVA